MPEGEVLFVSILSIYLYSGRKQSRLLRCMHEKREADSRLRSRYHVKCGGTGDSLHVNSQGKESEGMIGSAMCASLCNKVTAYKNFAATFRPHPF